MPTVSQLLGRGHLKITLSDDRVLEFRFLGFNGLGELPRLGDSGEDRESRVSEYLVGETINGNITPEEFLALPDADYTLVLREYARSELSANLDVSDRARTTEAFCRVAAAERQRYLDVTKSAAELFKPVMDEQVKAAIFQARETFASLAYAPKFSGMESVREIMASSKLSFFEKNDFASIAFGDVANVAQTIRTLSSGILSPLGDVARLLPSIEIPRLDFASLVPALDVQSLLKDFHEVVVYQQKLEEGRKRLEGENFGFADHLFEDELLLEVAKMPPTASAKLSRKVVAETRQADFERQLLQLVQEIPFVTHRQKVIRQALYAHRRSLYSVAVPVTLAQVEGIVTDILVHAGTAVRVGKKVQHASKTQPNGSGGQKPVELKGLQAKTTELDLAKDPTFAALGHFIVGQLCSTRNGVLHGTDVSYGTAEESARAVLVLAVVLQVAKQSLH